MEEFNTIMEMRWKKMMVMSVVFHAMAVIIIFFVPESLPIGRMKDVVYEVNLVSAPRTSYTKPKKTGVTSSKSTKGKSIAKKSAPTKRITPIMKPKKPLVVAPRTLKKKSSLPKKSKVTPSKLIDQAITKIETKVKKEDTSHVDSAIAKLEKKVGNTAVTAKESSVESGGVSGGMPIMIYQMEVEEWIKSNWSYPVAFQNKKDLQAIVAMQVKRDGTVLKFWLKKKSSNIVFDQSVMRAVEKSKPLPPFPEAYRKKYDDIEINFNLKDL